MHPIRKLILAFEARDKLPVEPDDVREWIIANGFCDRFVIHYVDCDPEAFDGLYLERQGQGFIYHASPYGEAMICREIFINENQPEEKRRIAEVKESLHILDGGPQLTNCHDGVGGVISYAATRVKVGQDAAMLTDVMAMPAALAVLFPLEARRVLKPAYDEGQLSAAEIARVARIEEPYVELVMSDAWEDNYQWVLSYGEVLNKPKKG